MDKDFTACSNVPALQLPACDNVDVVEGITLENHIFLISLLPCCSQLALPYWAKITGRIINKKTEEVLLIVVTTLFDNNGLALADYTDSIVLDGGEKGEFEIKLVEYYDKTNTYTLAVKEVETF